MPKVYNKRTDKNIPANAIYVGRPSKWGNPFPISKAIPREMSISLYSGYLKHNPGLLKFLDELKGKDLVCWCAPLPCHADILLEVANR